MRRVKRKDTVTIREHILSYLAKVGPSWAGQVDSYVSSVKGSKTSNVSRRCRELVNEGKLDVCYKQVEGKGPHVARYRLHQ